MEKKQEIPHIHHPIPSVSFQRLDKASACNLQRLMPFCDAKPSGCQSPVKAFVRGKTIPPDKRNVLLVVTGFMGAPLKVYDHLASFQLMMKHVLEAQLLENSIEDGKCCSFQK